MLVFWIVKQTVCHVGLHKLLCCMWKNFPFAKGQFPSFWRVNLFCQNCMTQKSKIVFNLSFHFIWHFLSTKATAVHVINGNYMTFELTSNKLNGLLVSSRCGTASLVGVEIILLTCYMLKGVRVVELIYRWGQRGKLKNYDTGVGSRARSVSQSEDIFRSFLCPA